MPILSLVSPSPLITKVLTNILSKSAKFSNQFEILIFYFYIREHLTYKQTNKNALARCINKSDFSEA